MCSALLCQEKLEKEKKLTKDLGLAATKLQTLLKGTQEQLSREKDAVKALQEQILTQAMSRSGLSGQSMDTHMDMSHLQAAPQQEDEPSDLEELEQFAKAFRQRRIELGFTQVSLSGCLIRLNVVGVL